MARKNINLMSLSELRAEVQDFRERESRGGTIIIVYTIGLGLMLLVIIWGAFFR